MQIYRTRCKHCGKSYWYNTYENAGCTSDYCEECARALNSVPVKFEPRWKKIDNPYLDELFQRIKENEGDKPDNGLPKFIPLSLTSLINFDNCVEMHHRGKHYRMYWNDDTPDEKVFYMEMAYDLINKTFTDEPWEHYENESYGDYYYHQHQKRVEYNTEVIPVMPMNPPSGTLFYMDPKLPEPDKSKKVKTPKLKHILTTRTNIGNGLSIKDYAKNGRHYYDGKSVVSVKDGVDIDSLMKNEDYEYTIEYYEDDHLKETLTNIRIK